MRAQRPGSRLQELEQELAKIHHRGSVFAAVPTPPIPIQAQQQLAQNLLTTALPVTTCISIATVAPNVVTPRSDTNTPIQTELQDGVNEVIFIIHNFFLIICSYNFFSIH